ncbi:MAG: site-specific DNA-methyltransferase [Acidobacteria bacterium]|nr:site-specific DNA-methyltransferase [Acidobacteriota bacterium]
MTSDDLIKQRSPKNKTINLDENENENYKKYLIKLSEKVTINQIINSVLNQDLFQILDFLPTSFVDLLFIDPPYNLTKTFNTNSFKERSTKDYIDWLESWFPKLLKTLKPTASVYICGDWVSSTAIFLVAEKYLKIQNRITWERDKGRGAKSNWKNCSEDIWFCTVSDKYVFNIDDVKIKRKVIAPYKVDGKPKDWEENKDGNYRLTHPSNIWTDLTVPYWSMAENTDHPTQKPEKLLAKIILASSNPGDVVLDPFLGSGTTAVVAKKLSRYFVGIEIDETYSCLAQKRLDIAETNKTIQGYQDNVFWERNSLHAQKILKEK